MASTHDTIRAAIDGRRHLGFDYDGQQRIVLPLRLGMTPKGVWQLRAVEVGDRAGGPALFIVAEMGGVVLRDSVFTVPAQYERKDAAFGYIDTQL
jgi:predicted DNA-binding transcriptional regulator YafY